MTPAIHIFCLILGYLALIFLLLRFGKTRSYMEMALFFLLAPVWALVLSACDLSIAIRVFAETFACKILRLAAAGFANVSAFFLIHVVQPRRYTRTALFFAASATLVVFVLGTIISVIGSNGIFSSLFFPVFGLSPGLAAIGFVLIMTLRSFRSRTFNTDMLFLAMFAILGFAGLGIFFLPGSIEKIEWVRNVLYSIFGLSSVAMIGFSLPFAYIHEVDTGEEGEVPENDGMDANLAERTSLLSNREMEIAQLLLTGKSYREIGEMLFIAPSTVKTHVLRIYEKAGVKNKMELANRLAKRE
jgi:DNA-binding CsgD family transcriptional regulator